MQGQADVLQYVLHDISCSTTNIMDPLQRSAVEAHVLAGTDVVPWSLLTLFLAVPLFACLPERVVGLVQNYQAWEDSFCV